MKYNELGDILNVELHILYIVQHLYKCIGNNELIISICTDVVV